MPTLLATSKMEPELVARIEASVGGAGHDRRRRARRGAHGHRGAAPRVVAMVRFAVVVVLASLAWSLGVVRRNERRDLEGVRSALLGAMRGHRDALTPSELDEVPRVETWLARLAGPYAGEVLEAEVREPGALAAVVTKPVLYVRGPLESFTTPSTLADAAAASTKDSFLLCLVRPPAERSEKVMLERVRGAYAGGVVADKVAPEAERLADAQAALAFLSPAWEARVRRAEDRKELAHLRRELDRAPLERGSRAMRTRYLVAVMDEPNHGDGPSEIDGEHTHDVRVAIVDMAEGRLLLSTRRTVDPAWISEGVRTRYASGLDGCGLAMDLLAPR